MHIETLKRGLRTLSIASFLALSACGGGGGGGGSNNGGGTTIVPAPSNLSYTSPQTFSTGVAITALAPTVTGAVTSYSVSPALPAGLALNATTGQITGTPTAASAAANYTITAQNATGSTTFALSVAVTLSLPAQPVLTLSFAPKRVNLDWTASAAATTYRVRKNIGSGFAQVGADLTATTYADAVDVHLADWVNTSYVVQACNASGCTDSAPRTLVPANSAAATGVIEPGFLRANLGYGVSVAMSADGSTLAVGAVNDSSGSAGIGGDPTDTSKSSSGAVHVYARDGGSWVVQAYVKASNPDTSDIFGVSVALSADGNTLAVGAEGEASNSGANESNNSAAGAGAAYLFVRNGTTWTQQAYLKATVVGAADSFARSVALSNDGNVFVAGAMNDDSMADTINGDPNDNSAASAGSAYVFVRNGAVWAQEAYLKASNAEQFDYFGSSVAISGDGQTIAVGAYGEDSNAVGVDGDESNNGATDSGAVYVFRRDSPVSWEQTAYLKASNTGAGDMFGATDVGIQRTLSFSTDGNTLAVGAIREAGGTGAETDNSATNAGAVYVFTRATVGPFFVWSQQAYVKPVHPGGGDTFGVSVALSTDGSRLAIGATFEDGNASGVGGTHDNTLSNAGAAYLFTRAGVAWSQTTYIKAPSPSISGAFGYSLALSGDATTLAVGYVNKDSTVNNSGAVCVF